MKIPKTTAEQPYIEFRFDKKGNMKLSACSAWWGGRSGGFISSNDTEGNTCYPRDLERAIKAFKRRKAKGIEKEILVLQNKLKQYQS